MKGKQKQMIELAKQMFKLAKEVSPETTFLNVAISERDEDDIFYAEKYCHIYNNFWETKTGIIEIWEDLE